MTTDVVARALEKVRQRSTAKANAYRWECDRPDCDGTPHDGAPYAHARTKQRRPDTDWFIWLLLLGRGWGKTRTGAECFLDLLLENPRTQSGKPTEWLIASTTHNDTVTNCLEGESGLFAVLAARGIGYRYNQQKQLITLAGGQRIHIRHAENENLARGKNLAGAWLDELGTFRKITSAWRDGLVPAMRAKLPNGRPRILITTTPKVEAPEAFQLIKSLTTRHSAGDPSVYVTTGATFENAHNLAAETMREWKEMYPVGSRSYRQELLGELCEDIEGAMWDWGTIHANRVTRAAADLVSFIRKVVCVDPAVTNGPNSDDTGMVLLGKAMADEDGRRVEHVYVLEDATCHLPVADWAKKAVILAVENDAELLIEVDQGGDMNTRLLKDAARDLGVNCPSIKTVRAATEGSKATRARPVVALYQNKRVHHVGTLAKLEEQQTTWVPELTKKSPDRVDALVHGVRHLAGRTGPAWRTF